ncbi:hypothetical protein OH491_03430 [Termitidicoccus mucosus]
MLGEIKLYAARNPRPRQADEGGLDDLVVINKVIISDLVVAAQDLAAEARQNLRSDIFVFQCVNIVIHIAFIIAYPVGKRQGIQPAAGPLVGLVLKEHGQFHRFFGYICGDCGFFDDCRYFVFHHIVSCVYMPKPGLFLLL